MRALVIGVVIGLGVGAIVGMTAIKPDRLPSLTDLGRALSANRDPMQAFHRLTSELNIARQDLYRRLGATGAVVAANEQFLLQTLRDSSGRNSTSLYNFSIHRFYENLQRDYLPTTRPARILEIGPGINLGVGLIFALTGAEKYFGLDIYMDPQLFAAAQYEAIPYLLELVAGGQRLRRVDTVMTVKNGTVEFAKDRIEYLYPRQSYDIPLPDGSLDYVFSHATMEHVADPERTVQAIHHVLVKGGLTAHQIDMRDHADFAKPLEFLKVDDETWRKQGQDPARVAWNLNRWRLSDFGSAFERAGFRILKLEVNAMFPVDDALRRTLAPRFQSYSLGDLSATGVLIVARKE
jgi:SAM-dependent methyltransferase